MRTMPLLLGLCLLTKATLAAEPIADFAKQALALDLKALPFGKSPALTEGFGYATMPGGMFMTNATDVSWMTNTFTAKYHQEFPSRTLHFGVRAEKIISLRISNSVFGNNLSPADYARRKADLIQIQEALLKASPQKQFDFEDGDHSIKYQAHCSPDTNSIVVQELVIAPLAQPRN
jgi:hypothetical protein